MFEIVVITHEMAVVRTICSKVAVLSHGRLVEEGTVEELFRAPRTEEAKQLIFNESMYVEEKGENVGEVKNHV